MATVNFLSCSSKQTSGGLSSTLNYCEREAKTAYDGDRLITGINCNAENAYTEMMCTKEQYDKTDGRMYYHLVQSFHPDEKITPEEAHKVACEFAERQFKNFEVVVATHVDAEHIHSHFVINSVSFEDGKKYHSSKNDLQKLRDVSDEICKKHGLSVVEPKKKQPVSKIGTREYRSAIKCESWKIALAIQIDRTMEKAKTREEFIEMMRDKGYQVAWEDNRKYITYTTPEGKKCRDKSLHEYKYIKENMNNEFRIRSQIEGSKINNELEHGAGREADTVRSYNRGELEWSNQCHQVPGKHDKSFVLFDGKTDNGRSATELSESGYGFCRGEREIFGGHNTGYEGGSENDAGGLDREYRETGWEVERGICFGTSQDEGCSEAANGDESGGLSEEEPVDIDASCDFVLDTAGDILGLLASVGGTGNDPDEEDKKHKQYVTETQDSGGPKMSM